MLYQAELRSRPKDAQRLRDRPGIASLLFRGLFRGLPVLLERRQLGNHAAGLVLQGLFPVGSSSHFDGGEDARSAHRVDGLMTTANSREDLVPFALDVCAIGVQHRFEPGLGQDLLTGGDVG